jgi:hypothetical protein
MPSTSVIPAFAGMTLNLRRHIASDSGVILHPDPGPNNVEFEMRPGLSLCRHPGPACANAQCGNGPGPRCASTCSAQVVRAQPPPFCHPGQAQASASPPHCIRSRASRDPGFNAAATRRYEARTIHLRSRKRRDERRYPGSCPSPPCAAPPPPSSPTRMRECAMRKSCSAAPQ